MTTSNTTTAVNTIEQAANEARRIWDASVIAERAAWATGNMQTIRTAQLAHIAAHDAWKAAERALQDMWRAEIAADEEARLQAMCEAYDAMEEEYGAFDDHAYYTLTTAGMTYLDYHYHTDSNA